MTKSVAFLALVAGLFALTLIALGCNQVARVEDNWQDVINKVNVGVEKVLYEKQGHPNFFVHVELRNQTPYDIGVDLSDKWLVLYPNQWGASDLDHRTVIDEEALVPKELNTELRGRLIEAFKANGLTVLSPGKRFDYYTNFNASGRREVDVAQGKFLVISIKGQLCFTDGTEVWDVRPISDLVIPEPVAWKTLPADAIVIER